MKKPTLFWLLLLLFTQVMEAQTPNLPVTPEVMPTFIQRPSLVTRIGNRIFASFAFNAAEPVYYSDDNGQSWAATPSVGEYVSQMVAVNNQLLLFTRTGSGNLVQFKVYRSSDLGQSFNLIYTFDEIWVTDANGNYTNLCQFSNVVVANNIVYLNYYSQDKTGSSTYIQKFRSRYSTDEGNTWQAVSPVTNAFGPAENVIFADNKYILVCNKTTDASPVGARVYVSDTPDFAAYSTLLFPHEIYESKASGYFNGKLTVVSNNQRVYQKSDFNPAVKFSQQATPFHYWECSYTNGHFYYVSNREIYRAPADNPADMTEVFSNYNFLHLSTWPPDFISDGINIYLASDFPLWSTDDGLTWKPMPEWDLHQWAGEIESIGSQLFMNNGVAFKGDSPQNLGLWNPSGLPENQPRYLFIDQIVAHQSALYLPVIVDAQDPANYNDVALFKSIDEGQTWTNILTIPDGYHSHLTSAGNRLYIMAAPSNAGNYLIHFSDDGGATWQDFGAGQVNYATGFAAAGDSAFITANNKVHYTYDKGQTWASTTLPFSTTGEAHPVHYRNGKVVVFNGNYRKVYVSDDGGQSFYQTAVFSGSSDYKFWLIDTLLFAKPLQNSTILVSKDYGVHWASIYDAATWHGMNDLAIHNGYLYGSRENYYAYSPTISPFSRIPMDQITDQLNTLIAQSGVVKGNVFYDVNTNCQNNSEPALNGYIIKFDPGNYYTTTNSNGAYGIALPPGTYTMSVSTPLYHDAVCANPVTFAVNNNQTLTKNIPFRPAVQVKDLEVTAASTALRPGRPVHFSVHVKNVGTQTVAAGATLQFVYPETEMDFVTANPAFIQAPGEVSFLLPEISPYTEQTFHLTLTLVPDPALTGQTLFFNANVANTFNDNAPADNSYTLPVTVTNSFDPNDKTAFTNAPDGSRMALKDKTLNYQIRFQNTGTDTAFQVVIRDTLSSLFEAEKIRTLAASHPYRFVLREGRIAEWHFDPIALPDSSTNEPASHGFVLFNIPKIANLSPGTLLQNSAGIYFDFNHPVITNTATTKLVRRLTIRESEPVPAVTVTIRQFPNPVKTMAVFEIEDPAPPAAGYTLKIMDSAGKLIESEFFTGKKCQWNRTGQPAGTYFWQIWSGEELAGDGMVVIAD